MAERDDGAWFAPKTFGYGAGLPIRWQGWALVLGHIGLILLGAWLLQGHERATVAWALMAGLLPLPLYAIKTRGGWRWRWGRRG